MPLDVAAFKGMDALPHGYAISVDDLKAAARRQHVTINPGNVVLAHTGNDQRWNDEVRDKIARSPIKATKNLVEAVKTMAAPPSTFVPGSAIGHYRNRGHQLLYEDPEPGNDFLAGPVKDLSLIPISQPTRPS